MMMMSVMTKMILTVLVAGCLLPPQVMSSWPTFSDYIDYIVAKSCLGEDLAVQMEKTGQRLGKECWSKEWDDMFSHPGSSPKKPQLLRKIRSLFKMPISASNRLTMCNLKAWKLLTPEYEVNYQVVEDFFRSSQLDEDLAQQFLELSDSCQILSLPPDLVGPSGKSDPMMKGVVTLKGYINCMKHNGMKICMAKEMKKLQELMVVA